MTNMRISSRRFGNAVTVNLSDTLYAALKKRCDESGDTIDHVIQHALAQALELEHHTIYQASTANALVQGVYQGCVTVGKIKTHGDFGLGTYDSLDGEGLMLDGRVWQALSDGTVVEPPDSATAPFWVCTQFEADRTTTLDAVSDWEDLLGQLDKLRDSANLFVAYRIDGCFDEINYRVACRSEPGTNLVQATSHQAEFTLKACTGTLMGFWSPEYAKTFNIPGYHLHLLSSDHKRGGHVLGIKAKNLRVQVMDVTNVIMALPESPQFLAADLSGDPSAALKKAEGAQR
jgi:acetolactate decarboxylase